MDPVWPVAMILVLLHRSTAPKCRPNALLAQIIGHLFRDHEGRPPNVGRLLGLDVSADLNERLPPRQRANNKTLVAHQRLLTVVMGHISAGCELWLQ